MTISTIGKRILAMGTIVLTAILLLSSVAMAQERNTNDTTMSAMFYMLDVSPDGNLVVFASNYSNLEDDNTQNDQMLAYILNRQTNTVKLVSKPYQGDVGGGWLQFAKFTKDGKYVLYLSQFSSLSPQSRYFFYDVETDFSEVLPIPNEVNFGDISADGKYIIFVGGGLFIYDHDTKTTTTLSRSNQAFSAATISDDGNFVAVSASSTGLDPDFPMVITRNAFHLNIDTGKFTLVAQSSEGVANDSSSFANNITADGQGVLFSSLDATNLTPTRSKPGGVYYRDMLAGTTELISQATDGTTEDSVRATGTDRSDDGRYIVFSYYKDNGLTYLDASYPTYGDNVFLRDRMNKTTKLITKSYNGEPLTGSYLWGEGLIRKNNELVFYMSNATNLVPNDPQDEISGIYVYDMVTDKTELVFSLAEPSVKSSITGKVTDETGNGMAGVTVDYGIGAVTTDSEGYYTITGLNESSFTITPQKDGIIFNPSFQEVPVPSNKTNINFQQNCVSSATELNMCELEVGDILLWRGDFSPDVAGPNSIARIVIGTYWWHAAIYVGGDRLAHATGKGLIDADQVKTDFIVESSWWAGKGDFDWVVLRSKASNEAKQRAANYAKEIAENDNPPALYASVLEILSDRDSDSPTYCTKLVWKAYMQSNINMETDIGLLTLAFKNVITADDLYYSADGTLAVPTQSKRNSDGNRSVFYLLSPADLILTDSLGRRIGHDPITGTTYNEIPGANYTGPDVEPESISLLTSINLTWTLKVIGTGQGGTYTVQTVSGEGTNVVTDTVTSTIEPQQVILYEFNNEVDGSVRLLKEIPANNGNPNFSIYLPLIQK